MPKKATSIIEPINVAGSMYESGFSLSILSIHNLHSVYTQLLGLLSVSYSQTIKLLTVWLIVPQFDFRGIGAGSAESVSEVWRESGPRLRAVPRSVACLRVVSLSRFNRRERGGGGALAEEEEAGRGSLLWSWRGHKHNGEIVQLGISESK